MELIQKILWQLPTPQEDFVPDLLACTLVSRSFGAVARSAGVCQRLLAKWEQGTFRCPDTKLPPAEDQTLVDQLFPNGEAPTDPFLILIARARLDRIACHHVDRLASVPKDRFISIDTICALGDLVNDEMLRLRYRTEVAEDVLTKMYWAQTAHRASRRLRAVSTWMEIAAGEIEDQADAYRRGVVALGMFDDYLGDIVSSSPSVMPVFTLSF